MGGQRELRWHEPEWHVARVRPVREPTHAHRWNSDADTYCKSNSNRNGYRDPHCNGDGHTNSDTECHSYTYSYGDSEANTYSERYADTKASPHPTASSITGNTRPRKFKKQPNKTNAILEKFLN